MGRKPYRFTGESYVPGPSGTFNLRREAVFEQIPGESCRFRAVSGREYLTREEQLRQDFARLRRAEKECSGQT